MSWLRSFDHKRPDGKPCPAAAVTRAALGYGFGADHRRRLVVRLIAGDLVELRPLATRRPGLRVTIKAVDVYRYALTLAANLERLERAHNRKAAKARRLAAQRQDRAERRLFAK